MLVHNERTFRDVIEVIRTVDVLEWVRNQRPNSKWVFYRLIQAMVTLTRLNIPVGASVELPCYIARNQSIVSLTNSRHTGEPYRDNLCLFRCLALQAGEGESSLERAATAYFERYIVETSQAREDFCGVDLTELILVEELFSVSIYVYSLDEHNQAVCIRRSVKQFPSMYINLYEKHFSFVKDIQSYSNCFVCKKCDKFFSKPYALSRHEQTCTTNVKHKFPGRVFQIPKTVFQELEDMGLQFDPADKFFPYFATWDIESFQHDVRSTSGAAPLQWTAEHVPASISVASNVPGHENAFCFVTDGDSEQLVSDFVEYLFEISDMSYRLLSEKFESVFRFGCNDF